MVVVVSNNLLVTLVTQKMCFVNNGLADKTSTEPGLALWAEKILKLNVFLCNFFNAYTVVN